MDSRTEAKRRTLLRSGIRILAALWLGGVVLLMQYQSGAHRTGLGSHPDEPAHYVTTLMVRDYLADGFSGNPLTYARNYYDHYPKVALGHYPPGYYSVGAVWMLLFSTERTSILLFQALVTWALAFCLFRVVDGRFGLGSGLLAGTIFVLVSVVQQGAMMVMADMLVACCAFAALIFLARFLEGERLRDALGFGLLAASTIMVKTSGLWLAPLPVIAVLLSRKLHLIRRPAFWSPAFIVLIVCAPWTALNYGQMKSGMAYSSSWAYSLNAANFFSTGLYRHLGAVVLIFVVLGFVITVLVPLLRRQRVEALFAVMGATVCSIILFHLLSPVGLEVRYLLPAIAPLLVFAAAGINWVQSFIRARLQRGPKLETPVVSAVLICVVAGAFLLEVFQPQRKQSPDFASIVPLIIQTAKDQEILISSDAQGEGSFIAAVALSEPRPGHTIRRASKVLASSDWMGRGYTAVYQTPDELILGLEKKGIRVVAVDHSLPNSRRVPHHALLEQAVHDHGSRFRLLARKPVFRSGKSDDELVSVYSLVPVNASGSHND